MATKDEPKDGLPLPLILWRVVSKVRTDTCNGPLRQENRTKLQPSAKRFSSIIIMYNTESACVRLRLFFLRVFELADDFINNVLIKVHTRPLQQANSFSKI